MNHSQLMRLKNDIEERSQLEFLYNDHWTEQIRLKKKKIAIENQLYDFQKKA